MSALEIITPATPPVEVVELRQQCRIDHADEDSLLRDYLAAALELVADASGLAIGRTVYQLTLDGFPVGGVVLLPRPPAVSVEAVAWTDSDGVDQTLDDPQTDLQCDLASRPARLLPLPGQQWPPTDPRRLNSVRITYTAGRDDGVPQRALQAVRLTAATWFAHRESITPQRLSRLPDGAERLLSGIRFRSVALRRFLSEH